MNYLKAIIFLLFIGIVISCEEGNADVEAVENESIVEAKVEENDATMEETSSDLLMDWNDENFLMAITKAVKKDPENSENASNSYWSSMKAGNGGPGNLKFLVESSSFFGNFLEVEDNKQTANQLLSALAGIPLFTREEDWRDKSGDPMNYNHVNPEFVNWFAENFYIEPSEQLGAVKAQEVFDTYFKGFCRLLVVTHDYLEQEDSEAIQTTYFEKVKEGIATGNYELLPNYMYQTYTPIFGPNCDNFTDAFDNFSPGDAVSFWIRRYKDGSEAELWSFLQTIMEAYDSQFETEKANYKYICNGEGRGYSEGCSS